MSNAVEYFETRCLSSLTKVFADEELQQPSLHRASALAGETFSFQVAYRSANIRKSMVRVITEGKLRDVLSIRSVGLVPSEMPVYGDHDEDVLRSKPGLYPDVLYPVSRDGDITIYPMQWRSLWVTITLPETVQSGVYPIRIGFTDETGEMVGQELFELEVVPAVLPVQRLIHTEWFHSDCLAVYYGVEVFSEGYWEIVESFIETAVRHGVNMILTPLFTPPLDTDVGGERPTVQLVNVDRIGSAYQFGFERLERWILMCDRLGVRYFEFSHLFTQWGAKHAPKIVGMENGEMKRLFGWETDAIGEEYKTFLAAFLPELIRFLEQRNLQGRCYFHVSDEPHDDHLHSYGSASQWVRKFLADFPTIDALSSYAFYERGLVQKPIPASNHIQPFLDNLVPDLWTYYCCSQYKRVANRFFSMPSARNRILGLQLYKFQIAGFLHWGYNFWYSQYSRKPINPYQTTDADCAYPSGDAFLVYPGPDGKPVESIRLEVLVEALQDLRALQLLESLIGRENTIAMVEEDLEEPITFDQYPNDPQWLLTCRERINAAIRERISKQAIAGNVIS